MSKGRWLRGLVPVLMSGTLLLGLGCNEATNFDPDALFSIEDYARDQDYALNFVHMMNQWHESIGNAKQYLDTNVDGLSFTESVPAGWERIDPSLRSYPWSIVALPDPNNPGQLIPATDEEQRLDSLWYYSSFQDASYQFASFDRDVPDEITFAPAKVQYMQMRFLSTPYGTSVGFGDSVMVAYEDGYRNPSMLVGAGKFWNSDVVTAQEAPSDIASYASMSNYWRASIDHMSSLPGNPQGEFDIDGETILVRVDLVEQATLDVRIDASIRSNARGNAVIWVEGEKRAEVVIEYFDTSFHGYYLLRESNFKEPVRF